MKNIAIFLIIVFLSNFALAQKDNNPWQKFRYELILGSGSSHFFGDLGGGSGVGGHFMSYKDLDWGTTQPALQIGMRYKLMERLAIKGQFTWGNIKGADDQATGSSRYGRNLSFKSNIFELATQAEFSFIKEYRGSRYITYKSLLMNLNMYVFGGIGAFHFNPMAQYDGKWYALQELGTEGQGIDENPAKYNKLSVCFPVGLGIKYFINKRISLGLEVGNRYTLTDYIDDVSGSYYDNDAIRANYGDVAAELADRRVGFDGTPLAPAPDGTPFRGNPQSSDSYFFMLFNVTYTYQKYTGAGLRLFSPKPGKKYQKRKQELMKELKEHQEDLKKDLNKYEKKR